MAEMPDAHGSITDNEEGLPPVPDERVAEARANLRERFPKLTEQDFEEVHKQKKRTNKLELFIDRLTERYGWSRSVCQQQLGSGLNDIRDC